MRFKTMLFLLLMSLLTVNALFAGEVYQIDPVHSSIAFSVRHMVISNVTGRFKEFSGSIDYDEQDLTKSSAKVEIMAASVDTDNERRDGHLRSADFFEAEKFPTLTFQTKKIEKTEGGYVAIGDLTLHGVTKEIRIDFSVLGKVVDPRAIPASGSRGARLWIARISV